MAGKQAQGIAGFTGDSAANLIAHFWTIFGMLLVIDANMFFGPNSICGYALFNTAFDVRTIIFSRMLGIMIVGIQSMKLFANIDTNKFNLLNFVFNAGTLPLMYFAMNMAETTFMWTIQFGMQAFFVILNASVIDFGAYGNMIGKLSLDSFFDFSKMNISFDSLPDFCFGLFGLCTAQNYFNGMFLYNMLSNASMMIGQDYSFGLPNTVSRALPVFETASGAQNAMVTQMLGLAGLVYYSANWFHGIDARNMAKTDLILNICNTIFMLDFAFGADVWADVAGWQVMVFNGLIITSVNALACIN